MPSPNPSLHADMDMDVDPVAFFQHAQWLFSSGDFEASERMFRTFTEVAPQFVQGFLNLGVCLERRGRFAEAVAVYQTTASSFPEHAEQVQTFIQNTKAAAAQAGVAVDENAKSVSGSDAAPPKTSPAPSPAKKKDSLDYSRFDSIEDSDDDNDDGKKIAAQPQPTPAPAPQIKQNTSKAENRPGFMDEDSDDDDDDDMPALEAVPGMEKEAKDVLANGNHKKSSASAQIQPPSPSPPPQQKQTPKSSAAGHAAYEALTGTRHPFGSNVQAERNRKDADGTDPRVPDCLVAPALTINLARREDRWEAMSQHARSFGLHLERVDAVDGRALDPASLASFPMCSPPEAGTVMSQARAMRMAAQRAKDSGATTALILEDDARFSKDAFLVLAQALREIPDDWDVLYLGANHLSPPDAVPGCDYVSLCTAALAMHAYVVRCSRANEAADYLETSPRACDVEMVRLQSTGALRVYCTDPPVATQAAGQSDIQGIHVGPELARMRFLGVEYDYEKEDAALTAADSKLDDEMASMDAKIEAAQARIPGSRTFEGVGRERVTVNGVEISSMRAELEGAARRARHFHEKYLLEQKRSEAARRRVRELEAGGARATSSSTTPSSGGGEGTAAALRRAAAAEARVAELEAQLKAASTSASSTTSQPSLSSTATGDGDMRQRLIAAEAMAKREERLRKQAEKIREHENTLLPDWLPRCVTRPLLRIIWPTRIPGSAVDV
ncbi:hypothetical protein PPROV_000067600 [Pycnococcus provasolii]|uniref:Glycosyltransferase family 25 protein n=1 Tax=Pycnococcus provasolii TaxID=41880 RepID=A0A830H8S9_9CHLO|nr:hypothetical protein PPROV_000067600 [Pycnococcus provasolii]